MSFLKIKFPKTFKPVKRPVFQNDVDISKDLFGIVKDDITQQVVGDGYIDYYVNTVVPYNLVYTFNAAWLAALPNSNEIIGIALFDITPIVGQLAGSRIERISYAMFIEFDDSSGLGFIGQLADVDAAWAAPNGYIVLGQDGQTTEVAGTRVVPPGTSTIIANCRIKFNRSAAIVAGNTTRFYITLNMVIRVLT